MYTTAITACVASDGRVAQISGGAIDVQSAAATADLVAGNDSIDQRGVAVQERDATTIVGSIREDDVLAEQWSPAVYAYASTFGESGVASDDVACQGRADIVEMDPTTIVIGGVCDDPVPQKRGRAAAVVSGAFCLSSNRGGTDSSGADWAGTGWIVEPEEGGILGLTSRTNPFLSIEIVLSQADQAKTTYPRYVLD